MKRRRRAAAGARGSDRGARLNSLLQRELAQLIPGAIRDPRMEAAEIVSVSEVRVTRDLQHAKAFLSVVGEAGVRQRVLDAVQEARGVLRGEIGRRLRLRLAPELHFVLDEAVARAARIDEVLGAIAADRRRDVGLEEVVQVLRGAARVLVTSHRNPDGDAIGSMLAACLGLRAMDKEVVLFNPDPVPLTFSFLVGADAIQHELPEGPFDVTLVLDTADAVMFPAGPPDAQWSGTVLVIDHHQTDGNFGQLVWREPEAAAVGVQVYRVLLALGAELTPALAEALYTSIISDTGSFRYQNTNPEALEVAAALVRCGVDPWRVASNLYETRPRCQLELLAEVLKTLEVSADGRAAALTVTGEMLTATGCTMDMVDGFVNYARGIRGVEVAMLLRPAGGAVRVSLRSRGAVDVSQIAERFGGGGHRNAAGCTVQQTTTAELIAALFAEVSRGLGVA